jgi:hypothetical protein
MEWYAELWPYGVSDKVIERANIKKVKPYLQPISKLSEYEKEQRQNKDYIPREYNGAIIGWTTDTIKSNIVDNLLNILEKEYNFTNGKEFIFKDDLKIKEIYKKDGKWYVRKE